MKVNHKGEVNHVNPRMLKNFLNLFFLLLVKNLENDNDYGLQETM